MEDASYFGSCRFIKGGRREGGWMCEGALYEGVVYRLRAPPIIRAPVENTFLTNQRYQ